MIQNGLVRLELRDVHEILKSGSGNCNDLVTYGVSAMRSVGIPTAVDFSIHSKYNFSHSWGVIFDESGKSWSFGPAEEPPGKHILTFTQEKSWRKLSKVYRLSFSKNSRALSEKVDDLINIPPFFRQRNITDVTTEYIAVVSPKFIIKNIPAKTQYLYMCVFNNNEWKPIQWSTVEDHEVVFENMGSEILYMIAYFQDNTVIPVGRPFILEEDGSVNYFRYTNYNAEFSDVKISNWLSGLGQMIEGNRHYLYVWSNNWTYVETCEVRNGTISLPILYPGLLYKFEGLSRPFEIVDGEVLWW